MCDCNLPRGYGWKGWQEFPDGNAYMATGSWLDLSHPLSSETPRVPSFPKPVFERIRSLPTDVINVSRMDMIVHIGTHVDSPRHFFLDAPALENVPLDRLSGLGIVWFVDLGDGNLIEPHHLAGLEGRLRPGHILLLDTGWHRLAGTAKYDDEHPSLSLDAADWMIAHGVKMLGLDVPTPELPFARREPGFDFPVHRRLLSHGILIAEHLTNLSALHDKEMEIFCAALSIVGGDGSPARIVAREIHQRIPEIIPE